MEYVNGGVRNISTKKGLKEAVNQNPDLVIFYSTSLYGRKFYNLPVAQMTDPSITLTVVGPDPYNSRKWYASITYNPTTNKHTVK